MMAYLMVIVQCTDEMIYELECDVLYKAVQQKYSVVKLLL